MNPQRADPIRRPRYKGASLDRLIEYFIQACLDEKAAAAKDNIRRQHRAVDMLLKCSAELDRRGAEAEPRMLALLAHPEPYVQSHAAHWARRIAPEKANAIRRGLAQLGGGNAMALPPAEQHLVMSAAIGLWIEEKGFVKKRGE